MEKETEKTNVHIRWMIRRDMPDVLDIENGSFENAWTEEDFIRCLRKRNCIGMIAEISDESEKGWKDVGFMVYELHHDQLHVLNFAVHPDCRRKGVGRVMAEKLIGKLSQQRRSRIVIEVRETNLSAQVVFGKFGFAATSVIRGHYDDSKEDAYVMQYRFGAESKPMLQPKNRISEF